MRKIIALLLIFSTAFIFCQDNDVPKADGVLSISRSTGFQEAIKTIENVSQETESIKIINKSLTDEIIGIPINQMHWRDALDFLIRYFDLELREFPGAFEIIDVESETATKVGEESLIKPDTKQIRISSIFFKSDRSLSQSVGIDWSTILDGKVDATINFKGASKLTDEILNASTGMSLESGAMKIDINALLKIIEANQKGSVIARPNITVLSGRRGFIQVGEDFSVTTVDEAGNTIEKFFETGIILDVRAEVLGESAAKEVIHLITTVEKSTAVPGELSTIIAKNKSDTEVLLFDGEETYIGGLFDTEKK